MTYLITAEEAIAALKAEILDHGFHEEGQLMRLTVIIAAELTQARADAKAAQALVLEEATKRLAAARETFCYASPGSDEEFTSLLLGFDTAAGIIRDLAPDAGTAELAKLRGERDALLDAVQANMLRPDYLRAERAEAERDRLAAELAAANAREAGLRSLAKIAGRARLIIDTAFLEMGETVNYAPSVIAEVCDMLEPHSALAQPSTEGGE